MIWLAIIGGIVGVALLIWGTVEIMLALASPGGQEDPDDGVEWSPPVGSRPWKSHSNN